RHRKTPSRWSLYFFNSLLVGLVRAFPLTSLVLTAVATFVVLLALGIPMESGTAGALAVRILQFVAFGVWWVANWLEQAAPSLPTWLDGSLVIILGFLPYVVADLLFFGRVKGKR
ncbi:MAG: hypothetical protein WEA09_12675, partial [Gemmatimonadota bacterium]